MADDTHRKTRASFYRPDRVAAARENVETHEWAARLRDEAVEAADAVLDRGLDDLWASVTGQAIPRSLDPGDGTADNRWEAVEGERWAITDGEWTLPTNDFGAYRESGLDDRGFFDPDLADDALLVNERYPELGEDWGVDDGTGFVDEDGRVDEAGTRYVPVAWWNHWEVWYGLRDDVQALRDAYLYTGTREYARAVTIVLDRIADVYPEMDISRYPHDPFYNSHGMTGQGRLVGSIWETNLVRNFVDAYDAAFPAQDRTVVEFLDEKAREYGALPRKDSLSAVRRNVEERLVTELLPAVRAAEVHGNLGMHQSALATAGVVMDEPDGYTGDAVEFLFRAGGLRTADGERWDVSDGDYDAQLEKDWRVTGGNVGPALVDRIDRDGYANEAAPNYNTIAQGGLRRVADVLATYDRLDEFDVDADLYAHPKFPRLLAAHSDLVCLDRYTPSIGDSAKTGDPGLDLGLDATLAGVRNYGDSRFAQTAHLLDGGSAEGLHGDVFDEDADALGERIRSIVDRAGPLGLDSDLLPSYGFVALRSDDANADGHRRALTAYFGRNSGDVQSTTTHAHQDALSLGLYAHELDLAPDLGYPEKTADWPKAVYWTKHTVSHNTVLVDGERQGPQRVGTPHLFGDDGRVGLFELSAPRVYPQTNTYRRTSAMIDVDGHDSYVVDVFRVAGGDEHHYSFHGAEGDVSTAGLSLDAQAEGTYAGPDVPRPEPGAVTEYDESVGSGFDYLTDVDRDRAPPASFAADWDVRDTWDVRDDEAADVGLRVTMLGDYDEVALADGEPPRNKDGNPDSLRYLLARRSGADLASAFTAVLEPYDGDRRVQSVDAVPVTDADGDEVDPFEARAVRVELDTGRSDYVLSSRDATVTYVVGEAFRTRGAFAVYSERDGEPVYGRLVDGTELHSIGADRTLVDRDRPSVLDGEVVDFTRAVAASNRIVLDVGDEIEASTASAAVGRHVFVDVADEDGWNGVYEVEAVSVDGTHVTLDVGDATTVRRYRDPENPDAGFEYVIESGADARVPADVSYRDDP